MKHKIDMIGFAFHFLEKGFDLVVVGNVAGKEWRVLAKLADQFLDVSFAVRPDN